MTVDRYVLSSVPNPSSMNSVSTDKAFLLKEESPNAKERDIKNPSPPEMVVVGRVTPPASLSRIKIVSNPGWHSSS